MDIRTSLRYVTVICIVFQYVMFNEVQSLQMKQEHAASNHAAVVNCETV